MPALSFDPKFLDALLSGEKQQTTRPCPRFKVGDIAHIYNQQRRRIMDKPTRHLTDDGVGMMISQYGMSKRQKLLNLFPAHFLGKVKITQTYVIRPSQMSNAGLVAWALADWFDSFDDADTWFVKHYAEDWMERLWSVTLWNGWLERYFEPYEVIR